MALGFEDSFLLTWRDHNDQDRTACSGLPPELKNFVYARNRHVSNIRCTLGPYNSSFFVHDGASYLWSGLPETLVAALQANIQGSDWIDRPRLLTLGAGDNFLLVTEKHAAVWDLRHYKSAMRLIKEGDSSQVANIVLHPYRFQSFISLHVSGTLTHQNIPPHQLASVQATAQSILQDTIEAHQKGLSSKASDKRESMQRRPSALQQRAQLRREWSGHSQEISAQAKGVKLSFSLNVSLGGLARMLG